MLIVGSLVEERANLESISRFFVADSEEVADAPQSGVGNSIVRVIAAVVCHGVLEKLQTRRIPQVCGNEDGMLPKPAWCLLISKHFLKDRERIFGNPGCPHRLTGPPPPDAVH